MWSGSNSGHIYAGWLYNLQGPVQNGNTGPLFKKMLGISKQQEQSIKPSVGPS